MALLVTTLAVICLAMAVDVPEIDESDGGRGKGPRLTGWMVVAIVGMTSGSTSSTHAASADVTSSAAGRGEHHAGRIVGDHPMLAGELGAGYRREGS